mmetsp:Transcript_15098/g.43508  ORF Transcript_15098/g.43508 Transcript_15098/m.43508 type:complete len:222 (-) Transcript_15098:134-799(-)
MSRPREDDVDVRDDEGARHLLQGSLQGELPGEDQQHGDGHEPLRVDCGVHGPPVDASDAVRACVHKVEPGDGHVLHDEDGERDAQEQRWHEGALDAAHHADQRLRAAPRQPQGRGLYAKGRRERAERVGAERVPRGLVHALADRVVPARSRLHQHVGGGERGDGNGDPLDDDPPFPGLALGLNEAMAGAQRGLRDPLLAEVHQGGRAALVEHVPAACDTGV